MTTIQIYDKGLSDRITDTGVKHTICFVASAYGISEESVKTYIKLYGRYPMVYTKDETEKEIVSELVRIERSLKIKKLNNVR